MKVCAVIAEFNPFHNGHKYLFDRIFDLGYTHIVVFMSGNFVQRGEPAIISKEKRALNAIKMGASLVIEVPTLYVLNTAEKYAFNILSIIKKFENKIDSLCFGVQCDNFKNLIYIKNTLEDDNYKNILKEYLNTGITFAAAREKALLSIIKNQSIVNEIKKPNNILAIEYLKTMDLLNIKLKCEPIQRCEIYKSASFVRNLILKNDDNYKHYLPKESVFDLKSIADYYKNERQIICVLRALNEVDFLNLPDISEGINNRIYKSIKKSTTLEEIFQNVKCKRYTLSRIRRLILCAFLGINKSMIQKSFPYIKVLASSKKGFEILKNLDFPIVSRFNEVLKLGSKAVDFFNLESKFTDIYYTFTKDILPCDTEKIFKIIKGD